MFEVLSSWFLVADAGGRCQVVGGRRQVGGGRC